MNLKPITTEKAIMMIESQNILTFQTDKRKTKEQIKKEIEEMFDIKINKIRTLIQDNKKNVYIKLNKKFPAIDIATKMGLM
ncbi:MAG: 50S ribosomal protein L23 [Nanoarchaeota archaeon]|nr:50S ribosomal protein L23 [Nanoarchaeota archaeon]MBU1028313.1 50S ribosomal protein L23 [Nanoarchaeota archaeon]